MTRRAWLLALLAVLVRAAAALRVQVIDSDSARDLQMAALIEQGRFADALRLPASTPPLHPYLTALVHLPLGQPLVAGVAVSVILGGLSVLPLYALARRTWDERVATSAALLYAFLPSMIDTHIEAMTEGTFMFFFLSATVLGWRALEERSWEQTIVAAACAALAWLARPEGIYLIPLFGLAALLRFSRFSPVALLLFAAVWVVLAFPYLCFIHAETGRWTTGLSPVIQVYGDFFKGIRHPELALQDFDEYRAVRRHGVILGGGGHLLANLFGRVFFYGLGPFLVLGLSRPRPADGQRALLAYGWTAAAGYLVPIAMSFVLSTTFSHRFLLVPAALLLPTAAAGLVRAADWSRRPQTLPLALGVCCLIMGIRDLRPRRADKIGIREAGLAIRNALGPGRRVYSTARAAEYYAGAEHLAGSAGAEAYVFCMPDLRADEQVLERRISAEFDLLGEFPSPARPGALPVRVYAGRRSP
ncbi:MAG TPA: glycosyltransferase family 39 protein [Planctomycetota bacterium]|nr:glycosyltransferase family 39 protein [Planctomycetota bacterium]